MSVIEEVCYVKGHAIHSYVVQEAIDPQSKSVFHAYEYRCSQCGKTLEEIEKYKLSSRGRSRQKKEPTNDHSRRPGTIKIHPPASGNEVAEPEPVPGPEPAVSGQEV